MPALCGATTDTVMTVDRKLPWKRFATVVGATLVGGGIFKLLVRMLAPTSWDNGFPEAGSILNQIVQGWLVIPENFETIGNVVVILAVLTLLAAILLKDRDKLHLVLLGLSIYMFAFAWETWLAVEPAATRILVVGVSLVVLMIARRRISGFVGAS